MLHAAEVVAEALGHDPATGPLAVRDAQRLQVLEPPPQERRPTSRRRASAELDRPPLPRPALDLVVERAHVARGDARLAGAREVRRRARAELARGKLLAAEAHAVRDRLAVDVERLAVLAPAA